MSPKERIVELKCIAPKIEHLIDEADDEVSATFLYKRLMQLAKQARDKYQSIVPPKTEISH